MVSGIIRCKLAYYRPLGDVISGINVVHSLPLYTAYIPLRRKTTGIGANANFRVGGLTQRENLRWPYQHVKTLKFALPPTQYIKFALPGTENPNASQWNIGCVGSPTQNFRVGHVHFMLFVLISFGMGNQCKPSLQWNMGFTVLVPLAIHRLFCVIYLVHELPLALVPNLHASSYEM